MSHGKKFCLYSKHCGKLWKYFKQCQCLKLNSNFKASRERMEDELKAKAGVGNTNYTIIKLSWKETVVQIRMELGIYREKDGFQKYVEGNIDNHIRQIILVKSSPDYALT